MVYIQPQMPVVTCDLSYFDTSTGVFSFILLINIAIVLCVVYIQPRFVYPP